MQIALDIVGRRVFAHKAVKGENFYCPLCGRGLNVCQGSIKTAYFAHKANDLCEDSWKYDMSEWHRSMQSRFPEEQREVVVRHHGKKHRADVLYGNQIIEFQHSPISMEEIFRSSISSLSAVISSSVSAMVANTAITFSRIFSSLIIHFPFS